MSLKDFVQVIDREGNLVHGSFLPNLDGILDFGICPPSSLPEQNKPKSFFGGRRRSNARCGNNMNYISAMVLKDANGFSFEKQYFWSPFFHYFVVAEHNDWGQINGDPLDVRNEGDPYCYYSSELTLYNQRIAPEEFIGFVTYPDYLIRQFAKRPRGNIFTKPDGEILNSDEINKTIIESLKKRGLQLPVYSTDGERIL
jgi:hypothetical protein